MGPNVDPIRDQLGDYVGQKYRLNWWFPEDYKLWQSDPGAIWRSLSDPITRAKFLKFLLYREPMNTLGAREFYLFVRKDVPTLGPASTTTPLPPAGAARPSAPVLGAALDRHRPGRSDLHHRRWQQAAPGVRRERHVRAGVWRRWRRGRAVQRAGWPGLCRRHAAGDRRLERPDSAARPQRRPA